MSRKAVRPPSLAEWTSEGNPVWKFQPNFLTNKAGPRVISKPFVHAAIFTLPASISISLRREAGKQKR